VSIKNSGKFIIKVSNWSFLTVKIVQHIVITSEITRSEV